MREIVLDTETTGFKFEEGDRIVEIGCVEIYNLLPTGKTFHVYVNPERVMPFDAFGVHGIGPDLLSPSRLPEPGQITLKDKPLFKAIHQDFLDFIGDARLVIHNAPFDMPFLNGELEKCGVQKLRNEVVDTLSMARRKEPNKMANLDALCRRFKIDSSNRKLHGALLDSELLAEVYVELSGGKNYNMDLGAESKKYIDIHDHIKGITRINPECIDQAKILKPSDAELAENNDFRSVNNFF